MLWLSALIVSDAAMLLSCSGQIHVVASDYHGDPQCGHTPANQYCRKHSLFTFLTICISSRGATDSTMFALACVSWACTDLSVPRSLRQTSGRFSQRARIQALCSVAMRCSSCRCSSGRDASQRLFAALSPGHLSKVGQKKPRVGRRARGGRPCRGRSYSKPRLPKRMRVTLRPE